MTYSLSEDAQQSARQRINRFVERFDHSYRRLAYYAALPLVLTPELLNYLRNQFLHGEVPWIAEVDLLLSDLCSPTGYEQYAMDAAVRAVLLEEMEQVLGRQRMEAVAQLLIDYVRKLARTASHLSEQSLKVQQWAAMVYLDKHRQTAVQQIAQSLQNAAQDVTLAGNVISSSELSIASQAELAQLCRITQELAPQLGNYTSLLEYASLVTQLLRERTPAVLQRTGQTEALEVRTEPIIETEVSETTLIPPLDTAVYLEHLEQYGQEFLEAQRSENFYLSEETRNRLQKLAEHLELSAADVRNMEQRILAELYLRNNSNTTTTTAPSLNSAMYLEHLEQYGQEFLEAQRSENFYLSEETRNRLQKLAEHLELSAADVRNMEQKILAQIYLDNESSNSPEPIWKQHLAHVGDYGQTFSQALEREGEFLSEETREDLRQLAKQFRLSDSEVHNIEQRVFASLYLTEESPESATTTQQTPVSQEKLEQSYSVEGIDLPVPQIAPQSRRRGEVVDADTELSIPAHLKPILKIRPTLRSGATSDKRWAIIVGISEYQHPSLNLKYAAQDATAFYQFLVDPKRGNFRPDHICTFLNSEATTRNITRTLGNFLKKPASGDVVLIYLVCHSGIDSDRPDTAYLLTYDTDLDDIAGTAFSIEELHRALREILLSERVIVLADTNHSAAVGRGTERKVRNTNDLALVNHYFQQLGAGRNNIVVLTSTEENEVSLKDAKWGGGHGAFTYYLLEGMKTAAEHNQDHALTVGELFAYVRSNVKQATNNRQHPSFFLGSDVFALDLSGVFPVVSPRRSSLTKVLIVASNPRRGLNLDREIRGLREVIESSQNRQAFQVEAVLAVRVGDLQYLLFQHRPQIVHFCGRRNGQQGLVFEGNDGSEQWVKVDALSDLFRLFSEYVNCVLLNACYAEEQANAIVQHIDYVIGMPQGTGDDAALAFAKGFYGALAHEHWIEEAFEFGKNAIQLELPRGSTL